MNAYEVKVGIGIIADNTVLSMPERLECEVLQKERCMNTLTFTFTSVVNCLCLCRPEWPPTHYVLSLSIRLSVRSFVTNLMNMIFLK